MLEKAIPLALLLKLRLNYLISNQTDYFQACYKFGEWKKDSPTQKDRIVVGRTSFLQGSP